MIVRLIIRSFLYLFMTIVAGAVSYISANIGQRVVQYAHYSIVTNRYPGKSRNPVGFVNH
jgi:hypothetical protein